MTRRRAALPVLVVPTRAGVLAVMTIAALGVACSGGSGGARDSSPAADSSAGASSTLPTAPVSGGAASSSTPASAGSRASGVAGPHTAPTVAPRPATTLPAVPLKSVAEFGTGLSVRVGKISYGSSTGSGRGALTGQPTVALTLVLSNSSRTAIAVNTVQVSATYGATATPAIPSYGDGAKDFVGSLAAGRSTSGVYLFLIPRSDQKDVDLTVWYRTDVPTVLFHGSVR